MTADSPQGDEMRKRRERLAALRTKRANSEAADDGFDAAPAGAASGAHEPMRLKGLLQGGANRNRQRKLLMNVMNVLTQTPEDGKGYVPETPFTQTGVQRLLTMLRERSSDETKPGAKVAKGVLKFLEPSEGEAVAASGVSIPKLQALARRIEAFRKGGGGMPSGF